jgi:6-phosphogluconolactonase
MTETSTPPRWVVGDNPQLDFLDRAAADMLAGALRTAIETRGEALLAVPGGRTPEGVFRHLADQALDWSKVTVTLVDERWVDPTSPDSNERLVRERLLQGPVAEARFIPMKSDHPYPDDKAFVLALPPAPLDAVLLGMGEDGHFASLFPDSPALTPGLDPNSIMRALAVPPADHGAPAQPRLSLTMAEIARAGLVVLLVKGPDKQRAIDQAQAPGANPRRLPIAALLAARPDVRILQG